MLHAYFYTIFLVFRYTSWHFYVFSRTNLLTSRHSASSLFYAVFVFQKNYTGNILGIGRNKSRTSRNSPKLPENRRGDGVAPRGPHTIGQRGLAPGHAPLCVTAPRPTPDIAPSPIKTPRREKPRYPIRIPERYRVPPPSLTGDWEGLEALPGTLPERGIATEGLLHHHACLRRDE
jgi:hypothetical protein